MNQDSKLLSAAEGKRRCSLITNATDRLFQDRPNRLLAELSRAISMQGAVGPNFRNVFNIREENWGNRNTAVELRSKLCKKSNKERWNLLTLNASQPVF